MAHNVWSIYLEERLWTSRPSSPDSVRLQIKPIMTVVANRFRTYIPVLSFVSALNHKLIVFHNLNSSISL